MREHEVPMWNTEEQDMMADAQAWVARRATKAYLINDDIGRGLDKVDAEWRPDDALVVEEVYQLLVEARRLMLKDGMLQKKECHDAD
jgi:hypothetical protein